MKKILIFDFDGTIADSLDAMVHIMNKLSHEYGYERITEAKRDQLRHETSQKILSDFNLSPWRLFLVAMRVKREFRHELPKVNLIPGIKSALETLKTDGYTLGIATSNSKPNVELFLKNHRIDQCFDFIYARTVFSKASILKAILRKQKFDPQDVLYVGDETRDIDAARKAGIGIISVTWGINSKEILAHHKPDHLISEPASLSRVLQT